MAVSDMRMAGSALRLNRSDLIKLLEDEESGTNTSEFLDIPLQNVETAGSSGVTGSFLSKGRGNVLGYREGGRPTVGYQGPAEAIRELISAPKPTSTAAKSESEGTSELTKAPKSLSEMSAQEIFGNYSKYDVGEQGLFGGQDVDYLRGQGVGDETIREIARMSSATQQTPAAVYQRLGGTLTSPQSKASGPDPQQYAKSYLSGQTDVGAQGIFGGQDVDAMRSQGYTDEQIRATAKAIRGTGQNIPDAVFRRLGNF